MHLALFLSLFLAVLAAAAPRPQGTTTCLESSQGYPSTTTLTIDATLTVTRTYTHTVTPESQPSSTSSTSSSQPAAPSKPYTVISARSGSPVHLLPMNAAGFRFHLGGSSASYCPTSVSQGGSQCPSGNVTALLGTCSMDVEVPGGQQIWATPDGTIGYTQAHSVFQPAGNMPCPFTYQKADGEQFGHLSTNVFGASGLMACPDNDGGWQVFAGLQNATVPNGNVSSCFEFDSLTMDYSSPTSNFSAWQYT